VSVKPEKNIVNFLKYFMKYFMRYFMKYFNAKNFMKFYIINGCTCFPTCASMPKLVILGDYATKIGRGCKNLAALEVRPLR